MSCNCIEKAQELLREDTSDPEARVEAIFSFTEKGIDQCILIGITYRKKKKDDTFGKPVKGKILGTYCPICGKDLREKEAQHGTVVKKSVQIIRNDLVHDYAQKWYPHLYEEVMEQDKIVDSSWYNLTPEAYAEYEEFFRTVVQEAKA